MEAAHEDWLEAHDAYWTAREQGDDQTADDMLGEITGERALNDAAKKLFGEQTSNDAPKPDWEEPTKR